MALSPEEKLQIKNQGLGMRKLRKIALSTQVDWAEKIKKNRVTLGQLEKGISSVPLVLINKMAKITLDVNPNFKTDIFNLLDIPSLEKMHLSEQNIQDKKMISSLKEQLNEIKNKYIDLTDSYIKAVQKAP